MINPKTGEKYGDSGLQLAWSAYLLPYIERQSLHATIDFGKTFDSTENATAASVIISTYLCPSVARSLNPASQRGPTDYGGIYGERIRFPGGPSRQNNPPKGVMLYDQAISIHEIADGTFSTLIIAEDSNWTDGEWINGLNIFDQAYAINFPPNPAAGIFPENEIRSRHPGGANGAFCDGSVRFLSETMDLHALAAICTRAGGEIIGDL